MAYKAGKKNLTLLHVRKIILSPKVYEKKFLPKPNHPYPPPSKVKWSAPNILIINFLRNNFPDPHRYLCCDKNHPPKRVCCQR